MKTRVFLLFFVLVVLGFALPVQGQGHLETGHHDHEFKRFRVAVNLAHAFIPSATDVEDNFVIIPVWGLDIQYWFNEHWGLGLKNDIEIAKYTLHGGDGSYDNELRENPFIISLPVYYTPWDGGLTFYTGPGIELEEDHNFWVYRLGIGYEFHMPGNWDFAPELVYDLKNGHYNAFTVAIGVGKRF